MKRWKNKEDTAEYINWCGNPVTYGQRSEVNLKATILSPFLFTSTSGLIHPKNLCIIWIVGIKFANKHNIGMKQIYNIFKTVDKISNIAHLMYHPCIADSCDCRIRPDCPSHWPGEDNSIHSVTYFILQRPKVIMHLSVFYVSNTSKLYSKHVFFSS